MSKVIIYTRFSPRPDGEECQSAQVQEQTCREYCAEHGHEVAAVFCDPLASGDDPERQGLWQALDSLKRGWVLVAWKYDRLARNVYLEETIRREAAGHGATIEVVEGGAEGDKPEDKLQRTILAAFAEYEKQIIALRTKHAMLRYQKNGKAMSKRLPYGYRVDPGDPRRMVPDLAEQATIDEIIALHGRGMSLRGIAAELDMCGYPPRDADEWSHRTIAKILQRVL